MDRLDKTTKRSKPA